MLRPFYFPEEMEEIEKYNKERKDVSKELCRIIKNTNTKYMVTDYFADYIVSLKYLARDRPDLMVLNNETVDPPTTLKLTDDEGELFTFDTKLPVYIWRELVYTRPGLYNVFLKYSFAPDLNAFEYDHLDKWKKGLRKAIKEYPRLCREFKQFELLKKELEESKEGDLKTIFERILPFVVVQPFPVGTVGYNSEKNEQFRKNVAVLKFAAYLCSKEEDLTFTPYTKLHQDKWEFLAAPRGLDRGIFAKDKYRETLEEHLSVLWDWDFKSNKKKHIKAQWEEIKSNKLSPGQILFDELYKNNDEKWASLAKNTIDMCESICLIDGDYTVVEFNLY